MKVETVYCDRCGDMIREQGQAFVLYPFDFCPPTAAEVQRVRGGDFCGAECVLKYINSKLLPGVARPAGLRRTGEAREARS